MNDYTEGVVAGVMFSAVVVCAVSAWWEYRARLRRQRRNVEIARRWHESQAQVDAQWRRDRDAGRSMADALFVHRRPLTVDECRLCAETSKLVAREIEGNRAGGTP